MTESLEILVVSPWNGGSHAAWVEGWSRTSRHRINVISHEASSWRWRMRGGAVTLAAAARDHIAVAGRPDLVVATDMLDLSAWLGLMRSELSEVPAAIYMHENQLGYPRQPGESLDQGLAWAAWRSVVAADAVWFNSDFHRCQFSSSLSGFLSAVPDHDHLHLVDDVEARSEVLPVGVDIDSIQSLDSPRRSDPAGPLVLSNHRWHHDKDVGAILRALIRLADAGVAFRLALVGDQRGGEADALAPLVDRLSDRVVHLGHQPVDDYRRLLNQADIVVSAARNEFFGISVVEAVAAGAVPVLPDALAYPEVIPGRHHDLVLYGEGCLTTALERAITGIDGLRRDLDGLTAAMWRFDWSEVVPGYDDAAERLAGSGPGRRLG